MRSSAKSSIATAAGLAFLAAAAFLGSGGTRSAGAAEGSPALTIGVDAVGGSATEVTYRIVVSNRGAAVAKGIVVTDTVPANTTFNGSVPPASPATAGEGPSCVDGAAAGQPCKWSVGDLAPGASATIDLTLALRQGTTSYTVSNAAAAAGPDGLSASNTDNTVVRDRIRAVYDTYVDDTAPPDTDNGGCPELSIRRDDKVTAFVRATGDGTQQAPSPFPLDIDRLLSARLEAAVKSGDAASPTTRLGLHRVQAGDTWATSFGCGQPGTSGTRTGATPTSAAEPSVVADVSGVAGSSIVWDVTDQFESEAERSGHTGWELIDEGSAPPDAVSTLHSAGAAGEKALRLMVVTLVHEPATCIETSPRATTTGSPDEAILRARLTDGARAQDGEHCNGAPTLRERVGFTVADDEPDVYLSSFNGKAAAFSSNAGVSYVDPATGYATVGVRLVKPEYGEGVIGDNMISAAWAQNCTPTTVYGQKAGRACTPGEPPSDEFNLQWLRGPEPATPQPPPPPPQPESADDPPPDAPPSFQEPSARSLSAAASRSRATWGHPVTISGKLASPVPECVGRQRVQLWHRYPGTEWEVVAGQRTSSDGAFTLEAVVARTAEYLAVADGTAACLGETSDPITVRSRPLIELDATRVEARRGARVVLFGGVTPSAGRRVIIERRQDGRWRRVAARILKRSRYRYPLRADWSGTRVFQARSLAGSGQDAASSRTVAITVARP